MYPFCLLSAMGWSRNFEKEVSDPENRKGGTKIPTLFEFRKELYIYLKCPMQINTTGSDSSICFY